MSQQLQLAHPTSIKLPPLTLLLQQQGPSYWTATCCELGIVGEGETEEEATESLQQGVKTFLEQASQSELEARLATGHTPRIEPLKVGIPQKPSSFASVWAN